MNQAAILSNPQSINADSLNNGTYLCIVSAAFVIALQGTQALSLMLLKFLWSNEGKAILGSSIFYPTAAMTVLFVVSRMVPNRVVSVCTGFCKRKALTAWKRIKKVLAMFETVFAKLWAKRAQILASARVLVGAWEIICL